MKNDPPITKEAYLHAQRDMANLPPERSIPEAMVRHARGDLDEKHRGGFAAWRAENVRHLPKLRDEIFPMLREMVKDIRQTVNEFFFGLHDHAPEPGAPMNPTQIMVTDELRPDAFNREDYDLSLYAGNGVEQDRNIER